MSTNVSNSCADYLFRIRLQGVLEITKQVDRENFAEWKRLERNRREEVTKWIEVGLSDFWQN